MHCVWLRSIKSYRAAKTHEIFHFQIFIKAGTELVKLQNEKKSLFKISEKQLTLKLSTNLIEKFLNQINIEIGYTKRIASILHVISV